jgi:hypothetical protein
MKTQKQRSAARRKLDLQDSINAAERAGRHCEKCGRYTMYIAGLEFNPSNHHDYRKSTHPGLRNNRENHTYLCFDCHRWVHANVIDGHIEMYEIRMARGDTLDLHPSALYRHIRIEDDHENCEHTCRKCYGTGGDE